MNSPSQELLPCPFCGGDAELDTMQFFIATETGKSENRAAVYCTSGCTADIGLCYSDLSDYSKEDVAHKVIDMWNSGSLGAGVPTQAEVIALAKQCGIHINGSHILTEFSTDALSALTKFAQLLLQREGMDKGPWVISDSGKSLQSDDFKYDVRIDVDGDFGDARPAYMAWLRDALNSSGTVQKQRVQQASALARYNQLMQPGEETCPIERLRFFLSNALNSQDWLDVEPFIDAVKAQQPTAPGGEVVETQWRRVNKVSGWASRWYFLDADDDIENVRKNFTSSEWEIETRDLVAVNHQAKEPQ